VVNTTKWFMRNSVGIDRLENVGLEDLVEGAVRRFV
jgi:hypothetical protein